MKKLRVWLEKFGIYLIIVVFGFIYSFIALDKYHDFQTGLDFGIYVQTFWNYIHFKIPHVTFYPTYGDIVWADHFTPSLMILTPLYFLWSDPKLLLILQSVLFVVGVWPIYIFAKKRLKNSFLAYTIAFSYLFFFGTQYALTFDFHSATYAALFLPWLFWFMLEKRWKLFTIFFFLAMGTKEDTPLLLAAVSLYLMFSRLHKKLGLILLIITLSYFFGITKFIMPNLSVTSVKRYDTPIPPHDILGWLVILFDSPIKLRTIFLSFASFIFLPLISGWFFIIPLTHFFINFFSQQFNGRWDIFLHYRVHLGSILAFSTILAVENLLLIKSLKKLKPRIVFILGGLLLLSNLILDYKLHLPLNVLAKKEFYVGEKWMDDNYDVIKHIPTNSYLLTQNNLAPQVANREYLFYYPKNVEKADYIFLDLHSKQPIINFWLSGPEDVVKSEIKQLIDRGIFETYYQKGDAILLRRVKK